MAHAAGKYAKAISDRSGMEFPYNEMVKEWNGSLVHKSEFEAKHPQLERQQHKPDAQSLKDARPARVEPLTVFVGGKGFFEYNAFIGILLYEMLLILCGLIKNDPTNLSPSLISPARWSNSAELKNIVVPDLPIISDWSFKLKFLIKSS